MLIFPSIQILYTAQAALAYSVGDVSGGLANNGMTDAQRVALSPDNPAYRERYVSQIVNRRLNLNAITNHLIRVIGSKIQIAGWSTYAALINSLKLSVLAFYVRLMVLISIIFDGVSQQVTNAQQDGLGRRYQIPIYVGFGLVIGCFFASIITIFAACQPFHKNWQINPDPGSETRILSSALNVC